MTESFPSRNVERIVALTRDLMLIPGTLSRPDDRRQCYEFVKNHLESLEHIRVREYECNGIPSLVATTPGHAEPKVLLCAHLDVIGHPDPHVYRSRIEGGRIVGPGAGDMKGALAIILEVFRAVHSRHPDASLGVAVTADEETGGEHGVGYLFREVGIRCETAMIPDGGSLNEVTVEEKGILHLKIMCEGHAAHAARPWLGDNPIEHLMDRLTDLRAFFDNMKRDEDSWYPTCAVTIIGTENETRNRVPSHAEAVLDIRFPPPHTVGQLMERIRAILGPRVVAEPVIQAEPTHLSPDPLYIKVTEEITGQSVTLVRDDGGSDARYMCDYNIPVMMSRPIVGNLHAEDEWIDIASMDTFYRVYERYLERKLGLPPACPP